MKKILLVGAMALCLTGCQTLNIAVNKTNEEGVRTVVTSTQHLYQNFDIALGVRLAPKDTIMGLLVVAESDRIAGMFDTDDRLLMQLKDGSEIVLRNTLDRDSYDVKNETRTDYNYVHGGWSYAYGPWVGPRYITPFGATACFEHNYQTTVAESYALYLITYPEMMRIINIGVKNLRIEVEDDAPVMGNPDKVQGLFKDMFECLVQGVLKEGNW